MTKPATLGDHSHACAVVWFSFFYSSMFDRYHFYYPYGYTRKTDLVASYRKREIQLLGSLHPVSIKELISQPSSCLELYGLYIISWNVVTESTRSHSDDIIPYVTSWIGSSFGIQCSQETVTRDCFFPTPSFCLFPLCFTVVHLLCLHSIDSTFPSSFHLLFIHFTPSI